MAWWGSKITDMLAHITGTGAPHTAAGVGADAAGTAAGARTTHAVAVWSAVTSASKPVGVYDSACGDGWRIAVPQMIELKPAIFNYYLRVIGQTGGGGTHGHVKLYYRTGGAWVALDSSESSDIGAPPEGQYSSGIIAWGAVPAGLLCWAVNAMCHAGTMYFNNVQIVAVPIP